MSQLIIIEKITQLEGLTEKKDSFTCVIYMFHVFYLYFVYVLYMFYVSNKFSDIIKQCTNYCN